MSQRPNGQTTMTTRDISRDEGAILPLVMVMTVVIAAVVIGLANWAVSSLAFGQVAEDRSDRLSAADAGMRYAIDQLKLRNAGCILDTQKAVLPGVQADFNDATASVTCERITSGYEGIQAYAAVMTGEGLPNSAALLTSQSGSNEKVLGGPVYMSKLAFSLDPPVTVKDGPLLYFDGSGDASQPCTSVKASTLPADLVFDPELIFGPVCVRAPWTEIFRSPGVPDSLGELPVLDGTLPIADQSSPGEGESYYDITTQGGCRVFRPGRYVTPPALAGVDAYFKTGNYVFEFDGSAGTTLEVRQGIVTAGRIDTSITPDGNEVANTTACEEAQADDAAGDGEYGATFYFSGRSHINVATQGSLEIHARRPLGPETPYVSVQALCGERLLGTGDLIDGTNDLVNPDLWCYGSDGIPASEVTAPANGSMPNFLFTDSGNNKEFVAHALVYAPLAQVEFGNVSNSATQKMLGGLIVSRLVLQSSTSATNFEIKVPISDITAKIQLTSTAVKDGTTSIQAVVEYRPYADSIEDRVRVNSWRVCDDAECVS